MRSWWMTLLPVLALSSCFGPVDRSYCDLYEPVTMTRPAAEALVKLDKKAARQTVTNNKTFAMACE